MVAKMIAEGMLKPLNYDNIPNFQKIDAEYRNPDYDPQNAYTVPLSLIHISLRLIAGFLEPNSGKVLLKGQDIHRAFVGRHTGNVLALEQHLAGEMCIRDRSHP